jgi:retron-type reverse transcriptase
MPKTTNHIFKTIVGFDTLYKSFLSAQKGKRYNPEVMQFKKNLEENLINIQNHLIWGSWKPGRWRRFVVMEPKMRTIDAPPFADRVVHHALVDTVYPLFERKFIEHSYACRKNKGFHAAAGRVQQLLRRTRKNGKPAFVLKADISKYFQSIDHQIALGVIGRTIRDPRVMDLFDLIIRTGGSGGIGIPVGALTSQLIANVYLNMFDHYIKEDLGVKNYCRYMDDFVVADTSKARLWDIYGAVENFLTDTLALKLNPKTSIFPASRGVDYCGYRIWPTHILPRKRTVKKARRKMKRLAALCSENKVPLSRVRETIMSFLGYMKHCNGHVSSENILQETSITRSKE